MTHHHTAQGLASLGRHGDSMLVHMSPHEVAGLNYLAKKQGTKLTVNPDTGLPEAFSLGGLFSSLLPMFAGSFFPGAGFAMEPLLAGAVTGGALAAAKGENPLMGGLMGGLGGMSGSNLAFGLQGAANPLTSAGSVVQPTAGGYTTPLLEASRAAQFAGPMAPGAELANTGLQASQSMMTNPIIRNAANVYTQAGGIGGGTGAFIDKGTEGLSKALSGAGNLVTGKPGAWEGFKNAFIDPKTGTGALTDFQAATKIGMPIGGAVLGGLEPSDLYGEPLKPKEDKYDPYATLNLSGDTGLRLLAGGGSITSNAQAGTGLSGLYSNQDMQPTANISQDGYGIGRLDSLAAEGSKAKAADMFYAMGGPVSFADGGDAQKLSDEVAPEQSTGITSLTPPVTPEQSSMASQAAMAQAVAPETGSSIIEQVATKLQQDPNYQPTNPIEAAIAKQIRGTDQQSQGIAGLGVGPSQPMAPSYTASQPIAPTYYAGMNTPKFGMARGGYLDGAGDGMSDSIPATIEGKQPARLADGEFVVPADVVSHLGNGSSKAGSKRLYAMLDKVRHARTGTKKQGREINPNKYLPA